MIDTRATLSTFSSSRLWTFLYSNHEWFLFVSSIIGLCRFCWLSPFAKQLLCNVGKSIRNPCRENNDSALNEVLGAVLCHERWAPRRTECLEFLSSSIFIGWKEKSWANAFSVVGDRERGLWAGQIRMLFNQDRINIWLSTAIISTNEGRTATP